MENQKLWESLYTNKWKDQRFFPNEELCRFLGRNYKNRIMKKKIALELGVGTGSNLSALLFYKFKIIGIDISKKSIQNCRKKFDRGKKIKFIKLNMLDIDRINIKFDLILDVFSSYNLNNSDGDLLIKKVYKKLKKGGIYFSYFPSKNSMVWKREKKFKFDNSTLKEIKYKKSPFYGNKGFFRFISIKEYIKKLKKEGFKIKYLEKTSRTYNNLKEYFEFIVIEAKK